MAPGVPSAFYLIVALGLSFGLRHKFFPSLGRSRIFGRTLGCAYCTGFHCGWITWGMSALVLGHPPAFGPIPALVSVVSWSLSCAWTCYLSEILLDRLESPHA